MFKKLLAWMYPFLSLLFWHDFENLTAIGNSKIGFLDVANRLYYDAAQSETTHSWTATQDCWFTARIRLHANTNDCWIKINNVNIAECESPSVSNGGSSGFTFAIPLKEGQTISFVYAKTSNGTNEYWAFPFLS